MSNLLQNIRRDHVDAPGSQSFTVCGIINGPDIDHMTISMNLCKSFLGQALEMNVQIQIVLVQRLTYLGRIGADQILDRLLGQKSTHIDQALQIKGNENNTIQIIKGFDLLNHLCALLGSEGTLELDDAGLAVVEADKEGLKVACGGKLLIVTEIQVPGKKRMAVSDYLRGHAIEKGTVLD